MSDPPARDASVFGGLDDAFDEPTVDPDAMDRMLLNLAATSDPPDWQLEPLAPDFLTPSVNPQYSTLPLHYIDTAAPTAPTPSNTPAHPLNSLPPTQNSTAGDSPSSENDVQVNLDGQVPGDSPPIISAQQQHPHQQPHPAKKAKQDDLQPSPSPPLVRKRPAPAGSSRSPQQPNRSSAMSGSNAKPRVPTAICSLCGKNISTNGANFRRHEQACRRQHAERVTSARPPTSPALVGMAARDASVATPDRGFSDGDVGVSRRDSDLFNVVRRLEQSISTLDVSARLCLRDALLSLSSKACNPHIAPTPEQEAMNRAAEYLVLRMLFLSGQQVLHTPPGTAGASFPGDGQVDNSAQNMPRSSSGREATGASAGNDGTVAASTGSASAIAKPEDALGEERLRPSLGKVEDKIADGA